MFNSHVSFSLCFINISANYELFGGQCTYMLCSLTQFHLLQKFSWCKWLSLFLNIFFCSLSFKWPVNIIGHSDTTTNTENTKTMTADSRHCIFWKGLKATKGVYYEFDGIPFIILEHKLLECQNGPDRNRALKEKQSINSKVKWPTG